MAHVDDTGPEWKGDRLSLLMSYAFAAFGRPGHVDANKVAAALQVAPGTVRRWVRAGFPAARREALSALILPSASALEQEQRELVYAREALVDISGRGAPVNPQWKEQGWLQPHVLAVVRLERLRVYVARIARADGDVRARERLRAGGGVVIEQEVFRNRFAAQVAKNELLEVVREWRVVVPSGYVSRGRTEAWLPEAPRPSVAHLVGHPQVRIPVGPPRKKRKKA